LKNYDDPAYWPIYDRAAKYHMILLFTPASVARRARRNRQISALTRMRPSRLDLIARTGPKSPLFGAHLGNPDYLKAAEIARLNPIFISTLRLKPLIKKKDDYGSSAPSSGVGVVQPAHPARRAQCI